MTPHFTHIGLIGKSEDSNVSTTLCALSNYHDQQKVEIMIDESLPDRLTVSHHTLAELETLAQS